MPGIVGYKPPNLTGINTKIPAQELSSGGGKTDPLEWLLGPNSVAGKVSGWLNGSTATNAANKENLEKKMAFDKEQTDTAVQRRKADMIAAGINPLLAAGSPADSAQMGFIPNQNNDILGTLGSIITSALGIGNMINTTAATQSNIHLQKIQGMESLARIMGIEVNTAKEKSLLPVYKSIESVLKKMLGNGEGAGEAVDAIFNFMTTDKAPNAVAGAIDDYVSKNPGILKEKPKKRKVKGGVW